jgi:uncharacterized phiE125 gp8 family phage protein
MSLQLLVPPETIPVSVQELRAHLRMDGLGADEDAVLMGYARAATDYVEQQTGLRLISQTWAYALDWFPTYHYRRFPTEGYIRLPLAPVQSVTSISYLDATTGLPVIWAPADYNLNGDRIVLMPGASWPNVWRGHDVVEIEFVVGYGNDWNAVPESIRQAIAMLAGYWFSQREAAGVGDHPISHVPFSVREIIEPYRVHAV